MVKADDRNAQRLTRDDGFPGNLVWVARFNDIRFFSGQNFFHGVQVEEGPVAGSSGNKRRSDQECFASWRLDFFRPLTWDDQQMLMAQGVSVLSLFLDVTLHTTAERGIKLRQIADLHR